MFVGFAEAHTGIQNDVLIRYSCMFCDFDGFLHIVQHIFDEIAVFRIIAVVHKTARYVVAGNEISNFAVVFEPPDIVDHIGTGLESSFDHGTFVAVDGDRYIVIFLYCFDDGNDTGDFLIDTYLDMTGTGGFSAYIYY